MKYRSIRSLELEPADAIVRLQQAYKQVFTGDPSIEDQELVLTDMAETSGFFRDDSVVDGMLNLDPQVLAYQQGLRKWFSRLFAMIEFEDRAINAIATADDDDI